MTSSSGIPASAAASFPVPAAELRRLRTEFEEELLTHVVPFWERHSWDRKHGGFWNCLDRTGAEFLWHKALTPESRIPFRMTAEGSPIYVQRKIFSECFYVMALAEYARASGDDSSMKEARRMFALIWSWVHDRNHVGRPPCAGEVPLQSLAVPMILMNLVEELTDGTAVPYERELAECQRAFLLHVKPVERRVYEFVLPDGSLCPDLPEGRQLNPGHAIEAGCFISSTRRATRPSNSNGT